MQFYTEMTEQQQWQIRAYGATEAQVQECITEYLNRKSSWRVVVDMPLGTRGTWATGSAGNGCAAAVAAASTDK